MVSHTQTNGARSAAHRAPRPRYARRSGVHPRGPLRFATGIVLMIALVSAGFAVEGFMRVSRSQKRVAALEADLASLQQRVGADERTAAGAQRHTRTVVARATAVQQSIRRVNWQLQSVPTQAQLADLRNELAGYAACIPQLQSEVASLRLSWKIDAKNPSADSFKLFSSAPASASC